MYVTYTRILCINIKYALNSDHNVIMLMLQLNNNFHQVNTVNVIH